MNIPAQFKLLPLSLLACVGTTPAADKPTIYNHAIPETAELDREVKSALGSKYAIVDVPGGSSYTAPKITKGSLPRVARTNTGEIVGGYVLVTFVIQADGTNADAVVLKGTETRLNDYAVDVLKEWRFTPATLDGVSIPTAAAQEFRFEDTPTEFTQQVLEPTGGRISRPKGWYYAEDHNALRYMWTLSREEATTSKPYRTGVRIQTFVNVSKNTGKTPKEFIEHFIAEKKDTPAKIIKTCGTENQGLFTRTCLETEEGPYHILYSFFWSNDPSGIAVITMAGTASELWDVYAPTFTRMSEFELLDMKRFEK